MKTLIYWRLLIVFLLGTHTFGRALFFTEFLTERGESLLHKLKRDESSGWSKEKSSFGISNATHNAVVDAGTRQRGLHGCAGPTARLRAAGKSLCSLPAEQSADLSRQEGRRPRNAVFRSGSSLRGQNQRFWINIRKGIDKCACPV